jgi:glucosamine-6-phosphate deaminase
MRTLKKDNLLVNVFDSRKEMGQNAANDIKTCILKTLEKKNNLRMIFAAAPSQNEVLESLSCDKEIPWDHIDAFHMDEYIGLDKDAPQGFGNFLKEQIFGKVGFKSVNYIDVTSTDPEKECERYSRLITEKPIDIVVMGIGENGHIAFNDPPVADFNDSKAVKPVALDNVCRQQQVNDGCFARIHDVPKTAITLTVPTLFNADYLFCIVPAKTKAKAVYATINNEVKEACPATILRKHKNAVLYLDKDSSCLI